MKLNLCLWLLAFFVFFVSSQAIKFDQFWSASINSSKQVEIKALISDPDNNVWVCGHYHHDAEFQDSSHQSSSSRPFYTGTSIGWRLFVAQYDVSGRPMQLFLASTHSPVDSHCSSLQYSLEGIHFLATAAGTGTLHIQGSSSLEPSPEISISSYVVFTGRIDPVGSVNLWIAASSPFPLISHGLSAIEVFDQEAKTRRVNLVLMVCFSRGIVLTKKPDLKTVDVNPELKEEYPYAVNSTLGTTMAVIFINNQNRISIATFQPKSLESKSNSKYTIQPGDLKAVLRRETIQILVSSRLVGGSLDVTFRPQHHHSKRIKLNEGTFLAFFSAPAINGKISMTRMMSSPFLQIPIGLVPHPSKRSHYSFFFAVLTQKSDSKEKLLEVGRYDVKESKHRVLGSTTVKGSLTITDLLLDDNRNIWLGGILNDGLVTIRFDRLKEDRYSKILEKRYKPAGKKAISGGYLCLHNPTGMSFDMAGFFSDQNQKSGQIAVLSHYSLRIGRFSDDLKELMKEDPNEVNLFGSSNKGYQTLGSNHPHRTLSSGLVIVIVGIVVAVTLLVFILVTISKQNPRVYRFSRRN